MGKFENLLEVLENRREGNKGIFFIDEKEDKFTSYNELYTKALYTLKKLQEKGLKKGSELIIQIEDNESYLVLFWAALLGGIIPVPIAPANNKENKAKLIKVIRILNEPSLIANSKTLTSLKKYLIENELVSLSDFFKNSSIVSEEILDTEEGFGIVENIKTEDIAFIQFTSGTTGASKGVVLTHGNLLSNTKAIISGTKGNDEDSSLSWMPLYHDMGFIGFHLTPLVANTNQYFMQTSLFIRRPLLWLKKASDYNIKILACPNFGYKYFLGFFKPHLAEKWDLSNVRVIFNGAEYISSDICDLFIKEMSKYGLRSEVMFPVYGMAEASLAVTFPPVGEGIKKVYLNRNFLSIGDEIREVNETSESAIAFVDEGSPIEDCKVKICGLNNELLPEKRIGIIHIKGTNVTSKYYNDEDKTAAFINEDGWLNTQDIGVIKDERLIFIGRYKDIIIIDGKTYYPHDLETIAEEVPEIELGRIAVCGILNCETKQQEIVIFIYYKKKISDFEIIAEKLIYILETKFDFKIKSVIPIREMPKTTSGKIQRYKLIDKYNLK